MILWIRSVVDCQKGATIKTCDHSLTFSPKTSQDPKPLLSVGEPDQRPPGDKLVDQKFEEQHLELAAKGATVSQVSVSHQVTPTFVSTITPVEDEAVAAVHG